MLTISERGKPVLCRGIRVSFQTRRRVDGHNQKASSSARAAEPGECTCTGTATVLVLGLGPWMSRAYTFG